MKVNQAWFSPDGSHVLFDWFGETKNHWAVVPVAGGPRCDPRSGRHAGTSGPRPPTRRTARRSSPPYPQADGTTEFWLLDPTGRRPDQRLSDPDDLPAAVAADGAVTDPI